MPALLRQCFAVGFMPCFRLRISVRSPWADLCASDEHNALQVAALYAGEVGYLAASIKAVADARVGDTLTLKQAPDKDLLGKSDMHICGMPLVHRRKPAAACAAVPR